MTTVAANLCMVSNAIAKSDTRFEDARGEMLRVVRRVIQELS